MTTTKLIQQGLLLVIASTLCTCVARAQTAQTPPVSKVFAILATSVDTNTATRGDDISLTTINDVAVNGKVVITKGTSIHGRIGGVISKGKDEPKSVLAIVVDKAVVNGVDIPLQAIIVAIAAPKKSLPEDPTYGMMHSNEPKMVGSRVATTGSLPASSKASSSAAVATAELKGKADDGLQLTEESQGAFGYEDLVISWHLSIPPPLTIFASKSKRLKLEAGSQMLLRMAEPRPPK